MCSRTLIQYGQRSRHRGDVKVHGDLSAYAQPGGTTAKWPFTPALERAGYHPENTFQDARMGELSAVQTLMAVNKKKPA
jgi:hypothetical protein